MCVCVYECICMCLCVCVCGRFSAAKYTGTQISSNGEKKKSRVHSQIVFFSEFYSALSCL